MDDERDISMAEDEVAELYRCLIDGWNAGDAAVMATTLADDALVIGFDGSQMSGRDEVAEQLGRIFADHATATYITKVRSIRLLSPDVTARMELTGYALSALSATGSISRTCRRCL